MIRVAQCFHYINQVVDTTHANSNVILQVNGIRLDNTDLMVRSRHLLFNIGDTRLNNYDDEY